MPFMGRIDRDLSLNQLLNITQVFSLVSFIAETEGLSTRSSTTGSSDSVHIRFRNVRQLEVDDMTQLIDVNTTRSNVGCNQNSNFSFFESVHSPIPLGLAFITMNGLGLDARVTEVLSDLIRTVLGSGENEGRIHIILLQNSDEQVALIVLPDGINGLLNGFSSGALASYFNTNR
jgi:hypothetical protein